MAQGFFGLAASSILAISIVFAAKLPQLSISLVIIGTATELLMGLTPLVGGLSAAFSLFLTAAFAKNLVLHLTGPHNRIRSCGYLV